jgi:hypothetical protein
MDADQFAECASVAILCLGDEFYFIAGGNCHLLLAFVILLTWITPLLFETKYWVVQDAILHYENKGDLPAAGRPFGLLFLISHTLSDIRA